MVNHRTRTRILSMGVLLTVALTAAACGASSQASGSATNHASNPVHVAFFGFSAANSFAQATWKGVQEAAHQYGATAHFFDGNFSATTQVQQMKDALVSDQYNVWVVQANDGAAVVPEVEQAISKGITVVAEFTPIGTAYNTAQPQVPGLISFIDVPTNNGRLLGKLGIEACSAVQANPSQVAYLQGDPSLPLDNARTQAVLQELRTDPAVQIVATPVGGYTQSQGLAVGQDLAVSHPHVNVIIGSSQAIEGVQIALQHAGLLGKVKLIGNGGSIQAVDAVKNGTWFATYYIPEVTDGYMATKYGIEHAEGKKVPMATNVANIFPVLGTQAVLKNVQGQYSD